MKNPNKNNVFFYILKSIKFPDATQLNYYPTWWDPNKKHIICDPTFINSGCEPWISSSYSPFDFQFPQLNTQLQPNKKYRIANPFLGLLIGGVSVIGRRD